MTVLYYFIALLYPAALFAAAELVHRRLPSDGVLWYVRKGVHILLAGEWFIVYSLFGASIHLFAVCAAVAALAAMCAKLGLVTTLRASGGKFSHGTAYYALSLSLLAAATVIFSLEWKFFSFAVCATCLGDGPAGAVGGAVKKHNPKIIFGKTVIGFLTCAAGAFLSCLAVNAIYGYGEEVYALALYAYVAAFAELLFTRGLDNLSVPIFVFVTALMFSTYPQSYSYVCGPLLILPVAAAVINRRALTFAGGAVGLALALTVLVLGRNALFGVFVGYFALATVADTIGKSRKAHIAGSISAKDSRRDCVQVLANGLMPCLGIAVYFATENAVFLFCYFVSLAESLADTCASEIGVLSARGCVDICTFKKQEKGMSGGVSLLGTAAAIIGSAAIAAAYIPFAGNYVLVPLVAAFGFAGCMFDSILGSRLQVRYRCPACGAYTERKTHCDVPTEKARGLKFMTNDAVNIISSAFSFCLALTILAA